MERCEKKSGEAFWCIYHKTLVVSIRTHSSKREDSESGRGWCDNRECCQKQRHLREEELTYEGGGCTLYSAQANAH
jgi:hypothetical protein